MGKPGRTALAKTLLELKKKHNADLVIANGENLAHGSGVTETTLAEIRGYGIDFITSGDHIWNRASVGNFLDDKDFPLLRPANYPPGVPGIEFKSVKAAGEEITVINLMGRVFFKQTADCPFRKIDSILEKIKDTSKIIIVDFHAEATSEKKAMGHYLDGRVSVIFGTHTHVPTSDFEVLPKGTAYVTDVGMVGPKDSVIGADKNASLTHFLTQLPFKYEIAESENVEINAVAVKIDEKSGKALGISRIREIVSVYES